MTAIFSGLEAEAYDRQYSDRELVQRIAHYFSPHKAKVGVITASMTLQAATDAALPIIVAVGVNTLMSRSFELLPLLIGVVFAIGVAKWLLNWVRRQLTAELLQDVVLALRLDAFTTAAGQDLSFYDQYSSGRIVSRITSDTSEFSQVLALSTDVIYQIASSLILIVLLFTIEWRLTLAVLAMAPFIVIIAMAFRNLARHITRQSARAMGEVNKAIQEAVTGISVAKNFRQEGAIYREFSAVNAQVYHINVRRGLYLSSIFPTLNGLSGAATAVLVLFGGRSAVAGVITIAAWYLFVATVDRFWFPIINLSSFWSQFQAGLSAIERVFALIDVAPAVRQHDTTPVTDLAGRITFEDVTFRYSAQEQVLQHFTLDVAEGETVALVGHTGAGKSSIIKLLARFYEFQAGTIRVDGRDIRTLDLASFRRCLGLVTQVPFLFDGTVRENIRYGRPAATDAEIATMTRRIGDGEWLETLPAGLDSLVGERGSRLSMGQRQLVALVRVLVQQPRIFILDEATASIDPFTEAQIQEALTLIMRRTTSIVIAHRLSTVRAADRIIVLEKGRIIEQGDHHQLLADGGHYAELYDTYFRHQSAEYIAHVGAHYRVGRPA